MLKPKTNVLLIPEYLVSLEFFHCAYLLRAKLHLENELLNNFELKRKLRTKFQEYLQFNVQKQMSPISVWEAWKAFTRCLAASTLGHLMGGKE